MIKIFKLTALLEGLSYLLLLFVAVPIKYTFGDPSFVKMLGMPHGMLFLGYVVLAIFLKSQMKWNFKDLLIILVCSLLPFGTFWMDKKYLNNRQLIG